MGVSACQLSVLSAIVACSLVVSIRSPASTRTKPTKALWGPFPRSQQHRRPSQSELARPTHSTQCAVACRCSQRSHLKSISTRALETVSRRLLQKRGLLQACTRDSWLMCCEASVAHSSLCSTIGPRLTQDSDVASARRALAVTGDLFIA